jgi:hypothetical protein
VTFSPEIVTAVLGVCSALGIVVIRDVLLSAVHERRNSQRSFLQARIEQAYTPLGHLAFMLLHASSTQQSEQLTHEISLILRSHGHLLSEQAAAACYTLLEDENAGASLLQRHFYTELVELKEEYYRHWYSSRPHPIMHMARSRNPTDERYVQAVSAATSYSQ